MKEYPKIQSIYKRDEQTHLFLEGEWSLPEFAYLSNNEWEWTEKIDGTNIRIIWTPKSDKWEEAHIAWGVSVKGKTDRAQIPKFLLDKLVELFPVEKFEKNFPITPMCLYGEGYGAKIQKGGGNYIPNGVSFILFDTLIDSWWLQRENMRDIADKLEIDVIPVVTWGTIFDAINLVRNGFKSKWGDFLAEGLVGKPSCGLKNRNGNRIITKIKTRDFLNDKNK